MSVFGTKQTFQPYPRMQSHVPDEAFEVVHKQFLEKEIVDLTATVVARLRSHRKSKANGSGI